jgi:hypothetical protein
LYFVREERLRFRSKILLCLVAAFFASAEYGFSQIPTSNCDLYASSASLCNVPIEALPVGDSPTSQKTEPQDTNGISQAWSALPSREGQTESFVMIQNQARPEGFHWGRALFESFTFLSIEQAYVVHDDYRWVTAENGIPFNHYWRDYKQSLHTWINSGWDDGDALLYSYVGHPIQGALTGYIQIQNDPKGAALELSNTKQYWHSRLKALAWNAVYSTQWNIGPLSELTLEKYGTQVRGRWNQDGTWPCTRKPCVTGVGQVDLVMTPVGGFAWMLTEDLLDKEIARRVEGSTRNHFLIDLTRCALNPIRGGANILHGKRPWYRASRDAREVYFLHQSKKQGLPADSEASLAGH